MVGIGQGVGLETLDAGAHFDGRARVGGIIACLILVLVGGVVGGDVREGVDVVGPKG